MATPLDTILEAIRSGVEGLQLALTGQQPIPVVIGKAAYHRPGIDPDTYVTVAKSPRPENVTSWAFGKKRYDYFIDLTIISPHTGPFAHLPDYTLWRDAILALFATVPLTGAPDVFFIDAVPADFLDTTDQTEQYDNQTIEIQTSVVRNNR